MYIVIIPVVFLICVCAIKKIPFIGGKVPIAFLGTGILAFLLGGIFNPVVWLGSWLTGFDRLAFIVWIIIFGSFFSTLQVASGAMNTVMDVLKALLGHTAQGLVLAVLIGLYIAGGFMGTVIAAAAIVGILTVPVLDKLGVPPTMICAILATGASMGAIAPPISNAVFVATGVLGVELAPVLQLAFITVGIGLVYTSFFVCKVFIGKKYSMPKELITNEKAGEILKRGWKTLIPVTVLMTVVVLNSIPAISFNLPRWLLSLIPIGDSNLFAVLSPIPIIGGLTNNIVGALAIGIVVSYITMPSLLKASGEKITKSLKSVKLPVSIQVSAGLFLGAFMVAGQIDAVSVWAEQLSGVLLKVGGSFAYLLAGMLLGAQSTTQNLLAPILGQAWIAAGVSPVNVAIASSHLAAAAQCMPPVAVNTFAVAGLVSGILGKPVDPVKSMIYTTFSYAIYLAAVGMLFLFI